MDRVGLRRLLDELLERRLTVEEAVGRLSAPATEMLEFASVDAHRAVRTGVSEVVYGAGKTAEQIAGILGALRGRGQSGLVTRIDPEKAETVRAMLGGGTYHPEARVFELRHGPPLESMGRIAVVSAGTSDRPVAEEAAVVAEALGNGVLRLGDVGVAGIHRLLHHVETLRTCRVAVVVAGMDGALPGVVAGLVDFPVIGVPTSVGYGASFGGVAALLTMLNACAPGVSVVNIDNGFGAAYQASLINRGRA